MAVLLNVLNRAVQGEVVPDFLADAQSVVLGPAAHRERAEQPVSQMQRILAALAVEQQVFLMPGEPDR